MSISAELFQRAEACIPGGVNSPVRAFKAVGGNPIFFKRGEGAYVYDEDGKRYIDYVGSWGPLILGHAHPQVMSALQTVARRGVSFGAPTRLEVELAENIQQLMPSIEQVRLVNSGTEATMSAIRLARGYTKRDKILKFIGCYHGHADCLLVAAGSGNLTFGVPSSAGVPAATTQHTLLAEYNNLGQVQEIFAQYGKEIAAVIVEPITGNMNCVLPVAGFLAGLRQVCNEYGSLLILDEVMTGFRVALGGAQQLYDIMPDLTTLGKVIGGGLPVGAFGGRSDIMQYLSPLGPVYQAGTLSGNPLAVAAGLKTLELISETGFHHKLQLRTQQLMSGMQRLAKKYAIPLVTNFVTGMFGFYFTEQEQVTSYAQVMQCDAEQFKYFFHQLLQAGIYLAPSAFEAGFVSSAHSEEDIAYTLDCIEKIWQR